MEGGAQNVERRGKSSEIREMFNPVDKVMSLESSSTEGEREEGEKHRKRDAEGKK